MTKIRGAPGDQHFVFSATGEMPASNRGGTADHYSLLGNELNIDSKIKATVSECDSSAFVTLSASGSNDRVSTHAQGTLAGLRQLPVAK